MGRLHTVLDGGRRTEDERRQHPSSVFRQMQIKWEVCNSPQYPRMIAQFSLVVAQHPARLGTRSRLVCARPALLIERVYDLIAYLRGRIAQDQQIQVGLGDFA